MEDLFGNSSYFDFSKVKFKEKEEKDLCVISPKLHEIDRDVINRVYDAITNKVKDFRKLCPPHFIYDLYNLYYNKRNETVWDISQQYNDTKVKLLNKFNKEKYKVISNTSGVNSFFFLKYLLQIINDFYRDKVPEEVREKIIKDLKNQKPQKTQQKKNTQNNNNTPQDSQPQQNKQTQDNNQDTEEELDQQGEQGEQDNSSQQQSDNTQEAKGSSKQAGSDDQQSQDQALEEASKSKSEERVAEEFDDFIDDETIAQNIDKNISQLFEEISTLKDNELLDTEDLQDEKFEEVLDNINKIDQIKEELRKIKFNKESLQPLIKQVLNESKNYFSSRTKPREIPLLESDSLSNLNNIEYLHPILKKIKLFDITVSEKEPIGKLDIYYDISGSMASAAYDEVSALTLTKAILLNMMKLNLTEDVYPFGFFVRPKVKNEINVILSKANCGTSLHKVVETIETTNRNSIIITDAQDHLDIYSEKAFFIGINTNFAGIKDDRYRLNNQLIHYDASKGTFEYCKEKTLS